MRSEISFHAYASSFKIDLKSFHTNLHQLLQFSGKSFQQTGNGLKTTAMFVEQERKKKSPKKKEIESVF